MQIIRNIITALLLLCAAYNGFQAALEQGRLLAAAEHIIRQRAYAQMLAAEKEGNYVKLGYYRWQYHNASKVVFDLGGPAAVLAQKEKSR